MLECQSLAGVATCITPCMKNLVAKIKAFLFRVTPYPVNYSRGAEVVRLADRRGGR